MGWWGSVSYKHLSLLLYIIVSFTGLLESGAAFEKINPNSTDLEPFFSALKLINWPVSIIFLLAAILLGVVLNAFAMRKLVRNQEIGFYGLSFGNDEKNLIIGSLLIAFIVFCVTFLISFVLSFVAVFFKPVALLVPVIIILGAIFLLGRLGIWAVLSIANRNIGCLLYTSRCV